MQNIVIQDTLGLTAKLCELPVWEICLDIASLGCDLAQLFDDEPLLPGIVLTQNGHYRGMIPRESFFRQMSRPYGQEIFSKRSVDLLHQIIAPNTLILSQDTGIVQAVQIALQRPIRSLYEPILIKFPSATYKVLDFHQLLLGYTQIPDLVIRELHRVEQQAQITEASFLKLQSNYTRHLQTEKMAALGQLVAGVAHEINNPVSFIHANLIYAENYINDLLELVDCCQSDGFSELAQEKLETLDIEFIKSDLPKLLGSLRVGTERICEIVKSLRTFSRLDEAEFKAINIHDGIDSTLMILKHRLKGKKSLGIKVIQDYGDLPLITCYAGQLNQVFMNILANAIDALEERDAQRTVPEIQANPSQITIQTAWIEDGIRIAIADNGPGMPLVVQKRIFDPFFTTKPVGKGTGMGLSISHQIIAEKHGGKLECLSTLGKGTEFIIQIPQPRFHAMNSSQHPVTTRYAEVN
jgi:signal transduction histidine kinase